MPEYRRYKVVLLLLMDLATPPLPEALAPDLPDPFTDEPRASRDFLKFLRRLSTTSLVYSPGTS